MFIRSVHATFYRNGKHGFKAILEITKQVYAIDQKEQLLYFCFMAQAHVLKTYLLKLFVGCVISRIEFCVHERWLRMLFLR